MKRNKLLFYLILICTLASFFFIYDHIVRKNIHCRSYIDFSENKNFNNDLGNYLATSFSISNDNIFSLSVEDVSFSGEQDLFLVEQHLTNQSYGYAVIPDLEQMNDVCGDALLSECSDFTIYGMNTKDIITNFEITGKNVSLPTALEVRYRLLFVPRKVSIIID